MWLDTVDNNEVSGSDIVRPTVTRATQALVLSSQLCAVLLLIAESWLEWGKNRLLGFYWAEGRKVEERDEAGSWRWLLIRDWTAANLPAASARHGDYWGGRNAEHACLWYTFPNKFSLPFLFFLLFSAFFSVVSLCFLNSILHAFCFSFDGFFGTCVVFPPFYHFAWPFFLCGQRTGRRTWLRSTLAPVSFITDISTRPICRVMLINQTLKRASISSDLLVVSTESQQVC